MISLFRPRITRAATSLRINATNLTSKISPAFREKQSALQPDGRATRFLRQKDITIKKFSTMDDALGALNRTEIDAVVGDEPMITYSSFKSYPNTTTLPEQVNKYKYAAVVRKSETELLAKINATIDRLKSSGELQKSKKHGSTMS